MSSRFSAGGVVIYYTTVCTCNYSSHQYSTKPDAVADGERHKREHAVPEHEIDVHPSRSRSGLTTYYTTCSCGQYKSRKRASVADAVADGQTHVAAKS